MNEVIVNTQEIESVWEKDHLCFVKMTSGKVWLCKEYNQNVKTIDLIAKNKGLIILPLSAKRGA